jgi:hypothetical protein
VKKLSVNQAPEWPKGQDIQLLTTEMQSSSREADDGDRIQVNVDSGEDVVGVDEKYL